jgi:hypothetical protein
VVRWPPRDTTESFRFISKLGELQKYSVGSEGRVSLMFRQVTHNRDFVLEG